MTEEEFRMKVADLKIRTYEMQVSHLNETIDRMVINVNIIENNIKAIDNSDVIDADVASRFRADSIAALHELMYSCKEFCDKVNADTKRLLDRIEKIEIS